MATTIVDQHFVLSVFHLLVIAPLFLFVSFKRSDTPVWIYTTFLALGILLFMYHGWRFIVRWQARSGRTWIHLVHLLAVAPLLTYIGYQRDMAPRAAYEVLMMVSWGMIGYHLFNLVRLLEAHPHDDE
jgi:hypothetical protein